MKTLNTMIAGAVLAAGAAGPAAAQEELRRFKIIPFQ